MSDISHMFNRISPTYDRVNRILSFGIDLYWRKKVAAFVPQGKGVHLLDCATGTADQILSVLKHVKGVEKAVGIDVAQEMLAIGKEKTRAEAGRVQLQEASVMALPYEAGSFTCVTISFGIRNVPNVVGALREMHRVLAPGGRLIVLEFSLPKNRLLRGLHLFYLRRVLPVVGGWISQEPSAYHYLNRTIESFPYGEAFCALLQESGFTQVKAHPLTGGIATIYCGEKAC